MAAEIANIFVLMLENRSFDHMLGFSGIEGTDAESGQARKIDGLIGSESNSYAGQTYQVEPSALEVMPVDPAHEFLDVVKQLCGDGAVYPSGGPYPDPNNSGFVADYAVSPSTADEEGNAPDDFGEIMKCYSPDQLPVLNALAKEFVVCDRWHSSLPGPTWPNRFFACAASSGGLDHSPTKIEMGTWDSVRGFEFPRGTIFDALRAKFPDDGWRLYSGGFLALVKALKGISAVGEVGTLRDFIDEVASPVYPFRYTWIEPDYGNPTSFRGGTSQHPMDGVAAGEGLIKQVYEAIRSSPHWAKSLLIITWDEHGGFYDHVEPPPAMPPGDRPGPRHNLYGFMFDRYGVRVPAVVVSPLIGRNLIDHRPHDHASIPKTIEDIFGLNPLTDRDAAANSLKTLVTLDVPRDTPAILPDPAPAFAPQIAVAEPSPDAPIDKHLPGFVHIAMQSDVALHPEAEPQIVARVQAIQTRGQADQYIREVQGKVQAAKATS